MGYQENKVESYLRRRVRAAGGQCYKLSASHTSGIPDRLVVLGDTIFVECKAPGEEPRLRQRIEHDRIRAAGGHVAVVASRSEVDSLVERLTRAAITHDPNMKA